MNIQEVAYHVTAYLILGNLALSAFTFGWFGWRASVRAMPFTALAGYIGAFFTAGLTGITAQLVFG